MNIGGFIPSLKKEYHSADVYLQFMDKWDTSRTADMQLCKLKEIWKDCIKDVPYYRDLVAGGNAPAQINNWDDFYSIPELTKQIMQDFPNKFARISGAPDFQSMTGGSTGCPIKFGIWHSEARLMRILKLVLWLKTGYEPNSKLFLIWGHSHLLGTGWRRFARHFKRKAKDIILGYHRADAYRLNTEACQVLARKFLKFSPHGLIGYASALDYFARSTREFHNAFAESGCRFVQPCSEIAPKKDSREMLRKSFNCKLIEEFAGVDFGQVAMRFEDESFQVFSDHYVMETKVTNFDQRIEEAVIITNLYPRYTPLIRYRQGDSVEGVTKLPHGHVTRFENLLGRFNDMVMLGPGNAIHSVSVFHSIHQENSVLNIQLVLENKETKLRLVTTTGYDKKTELRIRHRLAQVVPELSNIKIELVEDVETSRAGKRRWLLDKRTYAKN